MYVLLNCMYLGIILWMFCLWKYRSILWINYMVYKLKLPLSEEVLSDIHTTYILHVYDSRWKIEENCPWKKNNSQSMINVLKFLTEVAWHKSLDKQERHRLDCFRVFPVCFSDKPFVSFSPDNQHMFENRKRKLFQILEHLPYHIYPDNSQSNLYEVSWCYQSRNFLLDLCYFSIKIV